MLDELIAEALAHNLNVKVAAANVEQAAGVLTQTRSALFPQVGYDGAGGRARTTESGVTPEIARLIPNPQSSYQALLQASWEIDLWGRIRRLSESARANLLATDEARRGVILSLVAQVAGNYLTLRGLDAQLVIAKQTLGAYGESVKLFTLQFQYGQVSQMNVAQVQSQYETAAAQIPLIESQIAQTENALSVLLGRNPGPIPRGKSIDELTLPARAVRPAIGAAHAPARPLASRGNADRRQRADRRGQGALLSDHLADRRRGQFELRTVQPLHRTGTCVELRRTAGRADLHLRRSQRPGRAGRRRRRRRRSTATSSRSRTRSPTSRTRWSRRASCEEQLAAQKKLVAALQDYARLANLQYTGGYTSYTTVLQAEQSLFPAELTLATRAGVGVLVQRQHLQGDGRRLDRQGGHADDGQAAYADQ